MIFSLPVRAVAHLMAQDRSQTPTPNYAFHDIPRDQPGYDVSLWFGQTAIILGSNEPRKLFGASWAYSEDCARLRFKGYPASMRYEFGIDFTHGSGFKTAPSNDRTGVWILPEVRWKGRPKHQTGLFIGMGLGLHFADPSADLSSFINTMPTLDIGLYHNTGKCEWQTGLRWRHSSNAGTKKPNDGQNVIEVFVGYRF